MIDVTWEEFIRDIRILASKLEGKGFDKILVITKGGLIPAYFLAKHLGIDYISTFCVKSYDDGNNKRGELEIIKADDYYGARWLVVDDLIDSGETLNLIKKYYGNVEVAVVYKKAGAPKGLVDYFVEELPKAWVNFPWELKT